MIRKLSKVIMGTYEKPDYIQPHSHLLSLPISRHLSALDLRPSVIQVPVCHRVHIRFYLFIWLICNSCCHSSVPFLFFFLFKAQIGFLPSGALLCTLHPEPQQTFWAELFVLPDRPHTSKNRYKITRPCSALTCHLLNWNVNCTLVDQVDMTTGGGDTSETMYNATRCRSRKTAQQQKWSAPEDYGTDDFVQSSGERGQRRLEPFNSAFSSFIDSV